MFRLIVCGSRDFSDKDHLFASLDRILERHHDLVIVEGGARGADSLAREWARATVIPVETFPANWEQLGKRAGWVRNVQMADSMAHDTPIGGVVAFYRDPSEPSRGTEMMVKIASERGIPVWVPPLPAYQF